MTTLRIRGIGVWSPGVADWSLARTLLANGDWPASGDGRPAPTLMPANERRRAPESVLLALAVAEQACMEAGVDAATLPSVFASIYGDLSINDYMCATLRDDPSTMSPIRFHNSVHNAPSGYWSIATGAMAPTTSIAASRETFAAGLLEAACQAVDARAPVVLAAYDSAGAGPVGDIASVSRSFGCALVLDAAASEGPILRIEARPRNAVASAGDMAGAASGIAQLCSANPIAAGSIPLLAAVASGVPGTFSLQLSSGLELHLELTP
jgi:hypothetical protein